MPTYAYGCDACGHRFDAFQRFAEDPLRECPECGAPIRRLIQPVGIVFKGSGWYINDSRPVATEDRPKKSEPASTAPEKEAAASPEKSPAAKTEGGATPTTTGDQSPKVAKPGKPAKADVVAAD